jgi:hypothetical protein
LKRSTGSCVRHFHHHGVFLTASIFGAAIDPPPGILTRSLRQLSYDAARHPLARR